ncbi:MAG: sigma-54-dependent Fis family transcriptional regulator [Planctomycetes bacterium]|nr:sigma-54-dependent Fis family transcriptional regulator [Planctomycetota bacterium]
MSGGKVLLVDDDPKLLRLVQLELSEEGLETITAATGAEALRRLEEEEPTTVVLDLQLPDVHGKALLERLAGGWPRVPVVVLTAEGAIQEVVDCMRLGAVDFVQKPFDRERLITSIKNAQARGALEARVSALTRELRRGEGFAAILGESAALRRTVDLLQRASESDVTVLLEGESGTGKEVAARAVHAEGARRSGPFVAVNCGAIPAGLIESELFGHERGAFTGASATRQGCFEQADGGTIFLDEVGELRPDLQVRLLRVLQDRAVQRVGGSRPRRVDARVVAATNRQLDAMVAERAFREDLYYRLAVFPVRLPPLRERAGDVLLLAQAFVRRFAHGHARPIRGITPEACRALEGYRWPGNVRELENVLERAVILEDGDAISLGSLPDAIVCALDGRAAAAEPAAPAGAADIRPLDDEERRVIQRALELTGWNVKEAAERLRIGRATIYRKIERYGLSAP